MAIRMMKRLVERGLESYSAKYIRTDSAEPIYHICFGGMMFSYLVALPHELRHLEHEKHAKEHQHSTH